MQTLQEADKKHLSGKILRHNFKRTWRCQHNWCNSSASTQTDTQFHRCKLHQVIGQWEELKLIYSVVDINFLSCVGHKYHRVSKDNSASSMWHTRRKIILRNFMLSFLS